MSSRPFREAVKHDKGKPPVGIIPYVALVEEGYAMGSGKHKYSKHNYIQGEGLSWSQVADAALRHIYKFLGGLHWDEDSPELHHLGCARAELGMLLHLIDEGKGKDDRLEYVRGGYGNIDEMRKQRLAEMQKLSDLKADQAEKNSFQAALENQRA
jgi:hypothetical protein